MPVMPDNHVFDRAIPCLDRRDSSIIAENVESPCTQEKVLACNRG